ncbi:MAG: nuclease-related domain-containing protein [Terrimesophilobacter sp.]
MGRAIPEVHAGVAGASARREGERRSAKREARIREAHPKLGGLMLALSEEPQSTRAWAVGARGEEKLGHRLNGLKSDSVHLLHDRRIPGTKANIDHMVVCPSGVFVIDAKKYKGQPSLRVEGGFIRERTEKLMVGSRDCTKLVGGAQRQVHLVLAALAKAGIQDVPVTGMLCFVDADWPLLGGDFTTSGIKVMWPRKAVELIRKPGSIDVSTTQHIFRTLAQVFPEA